MPNDEFYVEEFLSGRKEAFEMLVRKYQNRILNIVYSLIGQDQESEDIVQEVFLKVYHHLKSFKKKAQFSTWLYRIAVNTVYDFLRQRRQKITKDFTLEKIATSYDNPQEAYFKKEKEKMLKIALSKVPLKYRTALIFKDIDDLSYEEIARILNCRLGTVESRIYRARQILKNEFLKLSAGLI